MVHVVGKVRRRIRRASATRWTGGGDAVRRVLRPGAIQTKLKVGPANDAYEREADAVAAKVMAGPAIPAPIAAGAPSYVQRMCAGCEDEFQSAGPDLQRQPVEEEEEELQAKAAPDGLQRQPIEEEKEEAQAKPADGRTTAPAGATGAAGVTSSVEALKGGGQPLPGAARSFFEPRFGADFSDVRVHTGTQAAATAKALNARAFTTGRHVVFGAGEYAPGTRSGGELMAHELTHVIQQRQGGGRTIQRDLTTPAPAVAPPAQPDLTQAEIDTAIAFNKRRYTKLRIELIQNLVGTNPTGVWAKEDIVAVAKVQEDFGLDKDGMVGPDTFQLLDKETSAKKLDRKDENCLVALSVDVHPETINPFAARGLTPAGAFIQGDFSMNAMLPSHCNCPDYEYRQFIRGHFEHDRAGVVTDEADWFGRIPGGLLPAAFVEDGDTTAATVNYGHRGQPPENANPKNRYENFDGTPNQANGCVYKGEDFPGGDYEGQNVVLATGDNLDLLIEFKGQVQRRGRAVQTKRWTAVNKRFVIP